MHNELIERKKGGRHRASIIPPLSNNARGLFRNSFLELVPVLHPDEYLDDVAEAVNPAVHLFYESLLRVKIVDDLISLLRVGNLIEASLDFILPELSDEQNANEDQHNA